MSRFSPEKADDGRKASSHLQEVNIGARLLNGVSCPCQVDTQFFQTLFSSSFEKHPTKAPTHLEQYLFSKVHEVTSSKINPEVLSIYQLIDPEIG